jgi:hypothetical protein
VTDLLSIRADDRRPVCDLHAFLPIAESALRARRAIALPAAVRHYGTMAFSLHPLLNARRARNPRPARSVAEVGLTVCHHNALGPAPNPRVNVGRKSGGEQCVSNDSIV